MRRLFLGFAVVAVALAGNACSHYRLGTGAEPTFRTLYVEPIVNRTALPQAHALVSARLREAFQRDGRVVLVNSADGADATLSLVITDYRREVATVRPGDTGLAHKFGLTLGASVNLRDNRTAKMLFEKRAITVARDAYTDSGQFPVSAGIETGGQIQSEYQTLPLLAEALAQRVTHAALDVW